MEKSLSWEANGFSASQEISRSPWNMKAHYRFNNSPPYALVLRQINPVHMPSHHFSHIRLRLPRHVFSSGFPNKTLYAYLLFPIRAKFSAYLIPLDLITQIIFGEKYRSLVTNEGIFSIPLIPLPC
jgi:hypothetical protein